ncbi:hypothetical protein GWI33_002474 [Rhynchophorus ferrugineus]|uniref:Regulatory protein zeste n=1 Tax=Rhynchophorus ferrugineus TaxID=354439 RepID=A0A834IZM2_RHYFE|nr:hypothetical protein GWI33_002474 [Rhynchophorus ferrugineus]
MYRLPAFTPKEVKFLEDLLEKNKSIINTTRGDLEMIEARNDCWIEIEKQFNAFADVPRSVTMLKKKYENLKRKKGLTPKRKRTTTKALGKENNDFDDNNTKAPARIETPTSAQSSSSGFVDDSEEDPTMLGPLKLVKEEIIHQSPPAVTEEHVMDIKPNIGNQSKPLTQPTSTSTEPFTNQGNLHPIYNGNEEKIKLLREKHQLEIELMKKETDAKLHRMNTEVNLLQIKIEEHSLKRRILELEKKRIMEDLE